MIRFIYHRVNSSHTAKVKNFVINPGTRLLKILFSDKDIHVSRSGKKHLDIWGQKLLDLKEVLNKARRSPQGDRRSPYPDRGREKE